MKMGRFESQSFANGEFNTFDFGKIEINKNICIKTFNKIILEEFNELNLPETKKRRLNYFKVKGATEESYSEKLVALDKERRVIYGIRNFGGDPDTPFIQLRTNFEMASKEDALSLYEEIRSELEFFNPLYLAFSNSHKVNADFFGNITMVSKADPMIKRMPWESESLLNFRRIEGDDYYEWYKKGYDEFYLERPDLKKKVFLNSRNIMELGGEDNLLHFVEMAGERIGLIAGEKNEFLGHPGLYFNEIFISQKWKGKGIAKAIQRKYVEEHALGHEFVWGTIDSNNLPSYKTAASNGRVPVRYECFVHLLRKK